jgi:hypothetical protein
MLRQNREAAKQKVIKSEDLWLFLRQNIWHWVTTGVRNSGTSAQRKPTVRRKKRQQMYCNLCSVSLIT